MKNFIRNSHLETIDHLEDEATRAYLARDFERSSHLFDRILVMEPNSPEGLGIRWLRACSHEHGYAPGGINLTKALFDYKSLANKPQLASITPEACLGTARVLIKIDARENAKEAKIYALRALKEFNDPRAMEMLGQICSQGEGDFDRAKEWYWKAFKAGSPFGLKGVALVLLKEKKVWRSVAASAGFLLSYPILLSISVARISERAEGSHWKGPFPREP